MKLLLRLPFLLLLLLASCSGIFPAPTLTPTEIPATEIPTATIVWFPPTSTFTPFPTLIVTPTAEQKSGLGSLFFTDDFNQPSLWNTSQSTTAKAVIDRGQLTLSISAPGPLTITSLRSEPLLADFYAEVTVSVSLCGPTDQFGVLFRASPGDSAYRFSLRCDGQMRFERSLSGTRSVLVDWFASGDAPSGAPARIKIGVWASGRELRLFLNDNFQFSLTDPYLPTGTIGFFAFAGGATPITTSFSALSVFAVVNASSSIPATATPVALPPTSAP